ncbi:hypothetical protein C8R43DRAFT_942764 [Mycena crocata]|nr:hypothetical protein C8R43DRAFT_942764 [Mycena crocata]
MSTLDLRPLDKLVDCPMLTLNPHPLDKLVKLRAPWLSGLTPRLGKSRDADDLHDIAEALPFMGKVRPPEELVESWRLFTCRSAKLYFGENVPIEGPDKKHPQCIDGPSAGQHRLAVNDLVTEGKCASHPPASFAKMRVLPIIAFDWLLWLAAPDKPAPPFPRADKPYAPLERNARVVPVSNWSVDLVECHNRYLADGTKAKQPTNQAVADFQAISLFRSNTHSNVAAIGRIVRALMTLPAPTEDDGEPWEAQLDAKDHAFLLRVLEGDLLARDANTGVKGESAAEIREEAKMDLVETLFPALFFGLGHSLVPALGGTFSYATANTVAAKDLLGLWSCHGNSVLLDDAHPLRTIERAFGLAIVRYAAGETKTVDEVLKGFWQDSDVVAVLERARRGTLSHEEQTALSIRTDYTGLTPEKFVAQRQSELSSTDNPPGAMDTAISNVPEQMLTMPENFRSYAELHDGDVQMAGPAWEDSRDGSTSVGAVEGAGNGDASSAVSPPASDPAAADADPVDVRMASPEPLSPRGGVSQEPHGASSGRVDPESGGGASTDNDPRDASTSVGVTEGTGNGDAGSVDAAVSPTAADPAAAAPAAGTDDVPTTRPDPSQRRPRLTPRSGASRRRKPPGPQRGEAEDDDGNFDGDYSPPVSRKKLTPEPSLGFGEVSYKPPPGIKWRDLPHWKVPEFEHFGTCTQPFSFLAKTDESPRIVGQDRFAKLSPEEQRFHSSRPYLLLDVEPQGLAPLLPFRMDALARFWPTTRQLPCEGWRASNIKGVRYLSDFVNSNKEILATIPIKLGDVPLPPHEFFLEGHSVLHRAQSLDGHPPLELPLELQPSVTIGNPGTVQSRFFTHAATALSVLSGSVMVRYAPPRQPFARTANDILWWYGGVTNDATAAKMPWTEVRLQRGRVLYLGPGASYTVTVLKKTVFQTFNTVLLAQLKQHALAGLHEAIKGPLPPILRVLYPDILGYEGISNLVAILAVGLLFPAFRRGDDLDSTPPRLLSGQPALLAEYRALLEACQERLHMSPQTALGVTLGTISKSCVHLELRTKPPNPGLQRAFSALFPVLDHVVHGPDPESTGEGSDPSDQERGESWANSAVALYGCEPGACTTLRDCHSAIPPSSPLLPSFLFRNPQVDTVLEEAREPTVADILASDEEKVEDCDWGNWWERLTQWNDDGSTSLVFMDPMAGANSLEADADWRGIAPVYIDPPEAWTPAELCREPMLTLRRELWVPPSGFGHDANDHEPTPESSSDGEGRSGRPPSRRRRRLARTMPPSPSVDEERAPGEGLVAAAAPQGPGRKTQHEPRSWGRNLVHRLGFHVWVTGHRVFV